ncbi:MAG: Uma2 family endonuclease, partial [Acidimicrobiales bacterium]
ADRLVETRRVEYVDEGVLLIMNPPALEHREVVRLIARSFERALLTSATSVEWMVYAGDYQWDLPDDTRRYFVPDLTVIHPDARTATQQRGAIAMVAEITSPKSADTVYNDRTVKPKQYAKGRIPLYLLVDQELVSWTLFGLAEGWQRYQVAAEGNYGESILLPEPFGFIIDTVDWPR